MVNWEDGQLVQGAYVEIDGVQYPVVMPKYSGNTPMTAENFNKMQTDLKNEIGEVIESGSNENGSYIKYSDGTLICTKKVKGTVNITEKYDGGLYHTPDGQYFDLGKYAQEFIDFPVFSVTSYGGYTQWVGGIAERGRIDIGKLHILAASSKTITAYYHVIAIGRWK